MRNPNVLESIGIKFETNQCKTYIFLIWVWKRFDFWWHGIFLSYLTAKISNADVWHAVGPNSSGPWSAFLSEILYLVRYANRKFRSGIRAENPLRDDNSDRSRIKNYNSKMTITDRTNKYRTENRAVHNFDLMSSFLW